jgi:hypothetical protein
MLRLLRSQLFVCCYYSVITWQLALCVLHLSCWFTAAIPCAESQPLEVTTIPIACTWRLMLCLHVLRRLLTVFTPLLLLRVT